MVTSKCTDSNMYLNPVGDCVCITNYIMEGGVCIEKIKESDCPEGAHYGPAGCYCPLNKVEVNGKCLEKKDCGKNSYIRRGEGCVCFKNYIEVDGECVYQGLKTTTPTTPAKKTQTPAIPSEPENQQEQQVQEPVNSSNNVVGSLPGTVKEAFGYSFGLIGGMIGGILALGLVSIILVRKFRKEDADEGGEGEGKLQEKTKPSEQFFNQPITPVTGPPLIDQQVRSNIPQRSMQPPPVRRIPPPGYGGFRPMPRGNPGRR